MVQPITSDKREGRGVWLEASWGQPSVGSLSPMTPETMQAERQLAGDHCVPTKGPTQVMVETVGAGT